MPTTGRRSGNYAHPDQPLPTSKVRRVEFGKHGSLSYRVLFQNTSVQAGLLSPWHDIGLYTPEGYLACVCKTPVGSWIKYEVAGNEAFNPLRVATAPGGSVIGLEKTRSGLLGSKPGQRPQPAHYSDSAAWSIGVLPQTWAETSGRKGASPLEVVDIGAGKIREPGETYYVKPIGAFSVEEGRGTLSWKIIAIACDDPMANLLKDCSDMQSQLPGMLELVRDWLQACLAPWTGLKASGTHFTHHPANLSVTRGKIAEYHEQWKHFHNLRFAKTDTSAVPPLTPITPAALQQVWNKKFITDAMLKEPPIPLTCPLIESSILFDPSWLVESDSPPNGSGKISPQKGPQVKSQSTQQAAMQHLPTKPKKGGLGTLVRKLRGLAPSAAASTANEYGNLDFDSLYDPSLANDDGMDFLDGPPSAPSLDRRRNSESHLSTVNSRQLSAAAKTSFGTVGRRSALKVQTEEFDPSPLEVELLTPPSSNQESKLSPPSAVRKSRTANLARPARRGIGSGTLQPQNGIPTSTANRSIFQLRKDALMTVSSISGPVQARSYSDIPMDMPPISGLIKSSLSNRNSWSFDEILADPIAHGASELQRLASSRIGSDSSSDFSMADFLSQMSSRSSQSTRASASSDEAVSPSGAGHADMSAEAADKVNTSAGACNDDMEAMWSKFRSQRPMRRSISFNERDLPWLKEGEAVFDNDR
eukprot:TRINITY_DN1553_c0_g1_i1.p1 TRINITY_DN1553_c0_g1~~TRINITY_DN1553_c0_g1_i1.p1  ORF type:complete len:701 (-),score=68.05 TRINITY_DN1553_c0_g1_i1:1270-3372(-)